MMKFFTDNLAGKVIAAIVGLIALCVLSGFLTAVLVAAFKFGYDMVM